MKVNGEPLKLDVLPGQDLESLLAYFQLSSQRVAIELNGAIIKKQDYKNTVLKETDNIEIIHFVGGGSGKILRAT